MATKYIKGGEALKAKLEELAKAVSTGGTLKVGFFEGSTEEDGTSIPMLAAIHNFGAPKRKIPPRPFFSNMVKDHKKEWPEELATDLKVANYDTKTALELLAETMKGQLRDAITNGNFVPLKPRTLKARGVDPNTIYNPDDSSTFGAKPLIRTGNMLNSVGSKVE